MGTVRQSSGRPGEAGCGAGLKLDWCVGVKHYQNFYFMGVTCGMDWNKWGSGRWSPCPRGKHFIVLSLRWSTHQIILLMCCSACKYLHSGDDLKNIWLITTKQTRKTANMHVSITNPQTKSLFISTGPEGETGILLDIWQKSTKGRKSAANMSCEDWLPHRQETSAGLTGEGRWKAPRRPQT